MPLRRNLESLPGRRTPLRAKFRTVVLFVRRPEFLPWWSRLRLPGTRFRDTQARCLGESAWGTRPIPHASRCLPWLRESSDGKVCHQGSARPVPLDAAAFGSGDQRGTCMRSTHLGRSRVETQRPEADARRIDGLRRPKPGPIHEKCTVSRGGRSLDHLVCAQHQRSRNREARALPPSD